MALPLFIVAIIGMVIFILAYLSIILSSFKHHTVTGLISIFPGLNLVVLPSIWSQAGKAFVISVIGLGVTLFSWYAGGYKYPSEYRNPAVAEAENIIVSPEALTTPPSHPSHNLKETALPQAPLYYLVYKTAELMELPQLENTVIRITLTDDRVLEGKSLTPESDSILLQVSVGDQKQIYRVAHSQIKLLEKLVKEN